MTLRRKTVAATCSAALALAWVSLAEPANARWTFHDDSLGERMTPPPGGTRVQTCARSLKAVSGFAQFVDVSNGEDPGSVVLPPRATSAVSYEVWKAPPGFGNFNLASEDETGTVYFEDTDGLRHDATRVARVTTPARTTLPAPVPSGGNPNVSDNYVFTSAPISARLRDVRPGAVLGLVPELGGGGIFVDVKAMNCGRPVNRARVDVVPRSRQNPVRLDLPQELVPVRVFGSRLVRVRQITRMRLGEAAPAPVPPELEASLRPRDVDGDGRRDRLYYFRVGDTEMMCIDTRVRVTGKTSDRSRFQDRNAIVTTGCDG